MISSSAHTCGGLDAPAERLGVNLEVAFKPGTASLSLCYFNRQFCVVLNQVIIPFHRYRQMTIGNLRPCRRDTREIHRIAIAWLRDDQAAV